MNAIQLLHTDLNGTDFLYHGSTLHLPLIGVHQSFNVCTVLAVTEQLKQKGFPIEINHIKAGLEKVQFPARWEIVRKHPLIIIDGAHNQDGIDMLKASVKQYLPNRTIVAVIGALRDKDTDYMIHALSDVFHTSLPLHRIIQELWMQKHLRCVGLPVDSKRLLRKI